MEKLSDLFDFYRGSMAEFSTTLERYLFTPLEIDKFDQQIISTEIFQTVMEDIDALIKGDPAARYGESSIETIDIENNRNYVTNSYKSIMAVMKYRIANYIYYYFDKNSSSNQYEEEYINAMQSLLRTQARKLSEETKVNTSIEIHPAARIGKRFVVDHGYGTVIGETCVIGNDCYILQGVTLGASGIKENDPKDRHPKIGDNVSIAGFARIFGNVHIGSNSIINGHTIIRENIPPDSTVSIVNQIQITKPNESSKKSALNKFSIYGLLPYYQGIRILGRGLSKCNKVEILNKKGELVNTISVRILVEEDFVDVMIDNIQNIIWKEDVNKYIISLSINHQDTLITHSAGWNDYIELNKNKCI